MIERVNGMLKRSRVFTFMMAFALIIGITFTSTTAFAYTGTVTGAVTTSATSTTPVTIKVINSSKSATVRICTFDYAGGRTSGKLRVNIYDGNGKYITYKNITGCNFSNTSTNLTLNYGRSSYQLRIYRTDTSRANTNKTVYLSVDTMNNCSF